MYAEQLLASLGQSAGLAAPLNFDASGCARLLIDQRLDIGFELDAQADAVQIYCVLAPLPAQGREALYRQLLEANLFGAGTAGSTLAVDTLTDEIILCRTVPGATTPHDGFLAIVESFVAAAEALTQTLATGQTVAQSAPQSEQVQAPMLRV